MRSASVISGLFLAVSLLPHAVLAQEGELRDHYEIEVRGVRRTLRLIKDAVAIRQSDGKRIIEKTDGPDLRSELTKTRAKLSAGKSVELLMAEDSSGPKSQGKPAQTHYVTAEVAVKLAVGVNAQSLAKQLGMTLQRKTAYTSEYAVLTAASAEAALVAMETLRTMPGVLGAEVQVATQVQAKGLPNDPLFSEQWHLRNTTQLGGALWVDANLTGVWDRYRGRNVTLAILDDGLQHSHPDLQPNYNDNIAYDYNSNDADPSPVNLASDSHGTQCAGVAGARGFNAIGVSGAAPEVTLTGFRLTAEATSDATEANAFADHNDVIAIKSNSWGLPDGGGYGGMGPLAKAALQNGATSGREGKGVIYVFAGGNGLTDGDNSNMDGYAASPYVIAVGAVNDFGFQSYYSEPGANLLISAPSNGGRHNQGIRTVDLVGNSGDNTSSTGAEDFSDRNYTRHFGGTSSACPLVSGVIALMLEARPSLGWRDVQEILIRTARKNHRGDLDWATNAAGLSFNHKYGAGLIDAAAAVALAEQWTPLPAMTTAQLAQNGLSVPIPDENATGVTRSFNVSNANFRVEHVTVSVTATHTAIGDLEIELTSPSGMVSRLAHSHGNGTDNLNWTYHSVRHWGESAAGTWTLRVADRLSADSGTLTAATLTLMGSSNSGARLAGTTAQLMSEANLPKNNAADPGEEVTFSLTLKNIGGAAITNLNATLLASESIQNVSAPQSYGAIDNGGGQVARNFSFRALGGNGMSIPVTLKLNDGATDLGFATLDIPLGTLANSSASGGSITINDLSRATPSPSSVNAGNLVGRLHGLSAQLLGFSHNFVSDVGVLLQGPEALKLRLFCGGPDSPANSLNLRFDDNAATYFPAGGSLSSNSYRCWDYLRARTFTGEPAMESAFTLGEFLGLRATGFWNLWVEDFSTGDSGSITGWQLNFTTATCTDNFFFTLNTVEGDENSGSATVSVTRSGGLEGAAAIQYATANGSADRSDYTPASGTLNFAPGELTKTFVVALTNDNQPELAETIQLQLHSPSGNATLGSRSQIPLNIGKNDAGLIGVALTSSTGKLNNCLNAGDSVEVTATFSSEVDVVGSPQILLNLEGALRPAVYSSGSGSSTLSFTLIIQAADNDSDGISINANSLVLNGGDISLSGGGIINLTNAAVASNPAYLVDNREPRITQIAAASSTGGRGAFHNEGDKINLRMLFSEAVNVVGSPVLGVNVGGTSRDAMLTQEINGNAVNFALLVNPADNDADGISIDANTLRLEGASITDRAGNVAILTHGPVAANSGYRVDNTAPALTVVALSNSFGGQGGWLNAGDRIEVRASFSEIIQVSGTPGLALEVGGQQTFAALSAGNNSTQLTFLYTISNGDNDGDGVGVAANALQGGSLTDLAGNAAALGNEAVAGYPGYRVDTTAPVISQIQLSPINQGAGTWLNAGDRVTASVTFSEPVSASVGLKLALQVGNLSRPALLVAGSVSPTLEFNYLVASSDQDTDGIAVGANSLSGGTVVDQAGNLVLPAHQALPADSNCRVDNIAARILAMAVIGSDSPLGEWHHEEHRLTARILFDEPVFISGGPQLMLDIGGITRAATYLGGSGNTTLEFVYPVVAADNDLDGVAIRANALTGGTVIDQAGNNVLRSHPAIAANPAFKVAGVRPSERDPLVDNQLLRSAIKRVGEPMSFTLSVGSPSLPTAQIGLQWLFNNKPLTGAPTDARNPSLHLPSVKLSDAGVYQARFTRDALLANGAGVTTCNPTQLCVAEDFSPPRQLWAAVNSRATLSCNAAGNGLSYAWRRRDGQALPAGSSGINTKTLLLPAASAALEGVYECMVSHFSGSVVAASTQLRVHQSTEDPSPLTITSLPAGRVGAPYSYSLRAVLTEEAKVGSFVVTGLPAGLKLDAASGLITGVPLKATANLLLKLGSRLGARSSPLRDCSLSIEPAHSDVDGVYHGWVARHPGLNEDCGSRLELTLTKTGVFSGKLLTGTTSTAFVGNMLNLPANALRRGQANITRSAPLPPCLLQFEIDPAAPNRLVSGPTSTLSSINTSGDDQSNGQPISAPISAWRGMNDPLRLPSHAGRYHVALQLPPSAVGNTAIPQGHGFAIITVAANGSIKLEGSSADGEKILSSTFLGAEGQVLLHQGLYTNPIRGSLLGELQLIKADSPAANRLAGQLSWSKQGLTALNPAGAAPATRTYRNGFGLPSASQGLLLEVIGGMYAPTSTQIPSGLLLPLGQPAPVPGTMFNATLRFSGGGIDRDIESTRQARFSPDALVSVDSLSRVTLAALPPATLPFAKTTLTATRSTGLFAGAFTLQDPDLTTPGNLSETELTRSLRFSGLIVPFSPTEHIGYGFFMLPQVPMSSSDTPYKLAPVESGALLFDLIDG